MKEPFFRKSGKHNMKSNDGNVPWSNIEADCVNYLVTSTKTGASGSSSNAVTISLKNKI